MTGPTTPFRRRIFGFKRFEIRSRATYRDDRFMYLDQSMWKRNGESASHVLFRAAVTGKNGLIAQLRVLTAMGRDDRSPQMPQ